MPVPNRSLGLAALGWWLAARGLAEPIEESFTRLEATGIQRLGKASRIAVLAATRRLARALREAGSGAAAAPSELFNIEPNPSPWLDRLDVLLNTPRIGLRLEKALVGDAEDFTFLLEAELAEDRAVMLAARLAGWMNEQLGEGGEPEILPHFLAQGWPLVEYSDRQVTFLEEFLVNLHTELSDAPAEITIPLGEPREFLEWLESETGSAAKSAAPSAPAQEPSIAETPAPTALDLPPPVPPTTPSPPIESPAAAETLSTPVEEPAHTPFQSSPVTQPAAPVATPVTVAPEIDQETLDYRREHRRLRVWALLLQVGWVVLLIIGWRVFQERSKLVHTKGSTPAPSVATATATAAPRVTPAFAQTAPSLQPVEPPPEPVAAAKIAPLPLKPELSVMPDELNAQASSLAAAGHHAEAVALLRRMAQIQALDKSAERLPRALVLARLASSLAALERWDEADAAVERAQALLEELLPTHDAETALGIEMVADYWASRERWPLAARLYQKSVQAYESTPAENSQEQLSAVNRLAGALRQIGDSSRAEGLYRQLVKAYSGAGAVVALDAASSSHNLANLLLVTNRAGEARNYYEQALTWLTKAEPDDEEAKQMAILMRANYERCLIATGIPEAEARQRALATTKLATANTEKTPATPAPGKNSPRP